MSVVGGSCVKVGRGGSDGSSAGSSVPRWWVVLPLQWVMAGLGIARPAPSWRHSR